MEGQAPNCTQRRLRPRTTAGSSGPACVGDGGLREDRQPVPCPTLTQLRKGRNQNVVCERKKPNCGGKRGVSKHGGFKARFWRDAFHDGPKRRPGQSADTGVDVETRNQRHGQAFSRSRGLCESLHTHENRETSIHTVCSLRPIFKRLLQSFFLPDCNYSLLL